MMRGTKIPKQFEELIRNTYIAVPIGEMNGHNKGYVNGFNHIYIVSRAYQVWKYLHAKATGSKVPMFYDMPLSEREQKIAEQGKPLAMWQRELACCLNAEYWGRYEYEWWEDEEKTNWFGRVNPIVLDESNSSLFAQPALVALFEHPELNVSQAYRRAMKELANMDDVWGELFEADDRKKDPTMRRFSPIEEIIVGGANGFVQSI